MNSLGTLIKELREKAEWPQRKLAYELDLDVAVVSRIENENNFPKKRIPQIIATISRLFNIPEKELKKIHLSDEIAHLLLYEEMYEDILKVSEAKVHYERQKHIIQSNLNFNNESN